jgi:23S rRNA G2069 N7-methylase RlmK/C1962 C5-methylase RlmI
VDLRRVALRLTTPAEDGALVQIKDHRQRFLGVGFYNSKSKIQVRVLDPGRVTVDAAFFIERIRAALAVRQKAPARRRFLPRGQRGERFFERIDR